MFQLIWNRCPAYKKSSNQPDNSLQKPVLYSSLVCEFGGVKITLHSRLLKSGVGKTGSMGCEVGCGEIRKESCEDVFLPLNTEKIF